MDGTSFDLRLTTIDDAAAVTALLTASYETLITFPEGSDGWTAARIAMPLMCRANPNLLRSGR